jgi:hypothetical protein
VGVLLFAGTAHTRRLYEPIHHLAWHHGLHVDTIRLQLCNAIWVLVVEVATKKVVHGSSMESLSLRYGAVLVCEQKCLEIHDFLAQLCDRSRQCVVLRAEQLDLGLEIGQPLLLALATLEGSDPI